jgi:hypothetical protein
MKGTEMEDMFIDSDRMLEAMRNPTISPEQESVEEQSEVEDETPLLKEILFGIAELKSMIRESTPIAAETAETPTAQVPAYTSPILEGF